MAWERCRAVLRKVCCVFSDKVVHFFRGKMAEKECPLQFHDFRPVDHVKMCPRYSAVIQRTEDEGIGIEELDTLQLELETLLAAASRRMRQLEAETQVLIDWQEKKDKKIGKLQHKSESASSGKRGRPPDEKPEKPSKKFKEASGKLGASTSHSGPGRPKTKKNIQQKMQEYEFTDDPLDVPKIPKNDIPNRFWASVEPYCADMTAEDLKVIEDLMKSTEDESEYTKVPPLGKHYTMRWAQEDLIEEQKEGSRIHDKKRGSALGNSTSPNTNDAKALLKKETIREQSEDICPFGPLTQRLISALVEENIMSPLDDVALLDSGSKDNAGGEGNTSPRNGNRPFSVPHTRALEARIREELLYQGLLDTDDQIGEETDDEVMAELKKRQAELKALAAHNRSQKQRLYRLAKEEMKKQDLRAKARVVDSEVMEAYRRIQAARQKKRSPTKKERETALRALRERETLLKLLDS
ncbi:transcriptional adapter 3-like [Ptychodera flava]|uniref:transcriptional adapter 3-like n=1 Tax=Ptychodera flava TaxID=63121 RepID=UPI00396A5257